MVKVKGTLDRKLFGFVTSKMATNSRGFQPSIIYLRRSSAQSSKFLGQWNNTHEKIDNDVSVSDVSSVQQKLDRQVYVFSRKKKCIKQRTEFIDDLLFPYPAQVNLLRNFITSLVYVIMSQFPSPLQLQKIKNKIKIKNQIKLEHNFGRKTLNATCTFTRVYAVCV